MYINKLTMDSFTYYFDVRFLPTEFTSYFSNQVIEDPEVNVRNLKKNTPQIINSEYTNTIIWEGGE